MRAKVIQQVLHDTDGALPGKTRTISKHAKMAANPFRFFRGSANLFFDDIANNHIKLPSALTSQIPTTTVIGDCHISNFGFLTEEGSHGDTIIFSPNDFDDACIGHCIWDITRFTTSLVLTQQLCQGVHSGHYASEEFDAMEGLFVASEKQLHASITEFLNTYSKTCSALQQNTLSRDSIVADFEKSHVLRRFEKKAKKRGTKGKHFFTKSALAKATTVSPNGPMFIDNPNKFRHVPKKLSADIANTFAPYVNDSILAITERLGAGTGSVNMQRFYLLVGPGNFASEQDLALCHIVEVKQQRHAAPLKHFSQLSPINRLNPAHLTANCQRKMQRKPDLVLDEVEWHGKHWLVRSRHHARVSISPESIGFSCDQNSIALIQYANACGHALALAHARGDRRSTKFEQAVVEHLPNYQDDITQISFDYAAQVAEDMMTLRKMIAYEPA